MKKYIVVILVFFASCKNDAPAVMPSGEAFEAISIPDVSVSANDTLLAINNGFWYYNNILFSGVIQEKYPSQQIKSQQSFYHGKEEGWLNTFYPDGTKESHRYYHKGEKDSVNTGWWSNGNLRFKYHFKHGNYDGDYKEWYVSGKLFKHIIYTNGNEISGRGWRENGKLFMNYVVKDNRRFGLMNSQLCYSLKNEKGEFIKSATVDSIK